MTLSRVADRRDAALVALAAVYLAAALAFAWNGAVPPAFVVPVLLGLPLTAVAIRRLDEVRPGRFADVLRASWPVAAAPLMYFAEVRTVELERARYLDVQLAAFDHWIGLYRGGVPIWPTSGPVDELANGLYASYYAIPVIVLALAVGRAPVEAARATLSLVLASAGCGVIWLLLPSGGWFAGGGPSGASGPFSAFVHGIYASHPHFAAAFPSEHVAHAVALVAVLRGRGAGRGAWLWPLGIALSTVIGQYHYLLDAVVGWGVGWAAAAVASWGSASAEAMAGIPARLQPAQQARRAW